MCCSNLHNGGAGGIEYSTDAEWCSVDVVVVTIELAILTTEIFPSGRLVSSTPHFSSVDEQERTMTQAGWCTIESDPAVFTEMIGNIGVDGVAVEELISLDEGSIDAVGSPLYGLVLLFKWKQDPSTRNLKTDAQNIFFAQQIVSNACATQAIVNILLNHKDKVSLGQELTNFYEFTAEMDPRTRGEMIGQSDTLRTVHNSFARSTVFSFEDQVAKDDDDVYHFVGFIYKDGGIWELDGLQPAPIYACDANDGNFKSQMCDAVQKRIGELSALDKTGQGQGISFSLMAVVGDKISQLELDIAMAMSEGKDVDFLQAQVDELRQKREAGKRENVRRRHNYIPCVIHLLSALAAKGKLQGAIEATKKRTAEKRAAKQARKQGTA